MFDVAVYTDVRAAEAVDGIDGFNFESVSEGVTQADLQVIRRELLHEVFLAWEGDPLEHPESFGVVRRDGRLYVARGRSTGRTSNGRRGNELTQVIVTDDPDDLGGMNPAQLLGATNWRLEKAGSRTSEQWASPLEVDPAFEAEGLAGLVHEGPWARDVLPVALTMTFEAVAGTSRLVIVSSSARLAQRWIAFLLLALDPEAAGEIEVHGLVDDAMTSPGRIIATSPAFGRAPAATGAVAGTHVLDLDAHQVSDVTVTPVARTIASWITDTDVDTALEAVSAYRRWEPVVGEDAALRVAAATALDEGQGARETWVASVRLLEQLAATGRTDDLLFYGDDLLDVASAHRVEGAEDAELAAEALTALVRADQDEAATALAVSTLESLRAGTTEASTWIRTVAARAEGRPLAWEDADLGGAAGEGLAALARGLDAQQASDLLVVVRALGLELPTAEVAEATRTIASAWVTSPELGRDRQRWAYEPEVVRELAGAVVAAWGAREPRALRALGTGEYSWLSESRAVPADLRGEMLAWVEAGWVAAVPEADRVRELERSAALPPSSWRLVLGEGSLLEKQELVAAWLHSQHGLSSEAAGVLRGEIHGRLEQREPLQALRPLLRDLVACGDGVHDIPLATLARRVVDLDAALTGPRRRAAGDSGLQPFLDDVDLLAFVHDRLGGHLSGASDVAAVDALARKAPDLTVSALELGLGLRRVTAERLAVGVRTALALRSSASPEVVAVAERFLTLVGDERGTRDRLEDAREQGLLAPETATAFDEFTETASKGRTLRKMKRMTSRLTGPRSGRSHSDSDSDQK